MPFSTRFLHSGYYKNLEVVSGQLEAVDGEAADFGWFLPENFPPTGVPYPARLFGESTQAFFEYE